jgi:hypothetical protein
METHSADLIIARTFGDEKKAEELTGDRRYYLHRFSAAYFKHPKDHSSYAASLSVEEPQGQPFS